MKKSLKHQFLNFEWCAHLRNCYRMESRIYAVPSSAEQLTA